VSDAQTLGLPDRVRFGGHSWAVAERDFEVEAQYVL
jgi:hypothetical protein